MGSVDFPKYLFPHVNSYVLSGNSGVSNRTVDLQFYINYRCLFEYTGNIRNA